MYITREQSINEDQFVDLCRKSGCGNDRFSTCALRCIYQNIAPIFDMKNYDDNLDDAGGLDQWLQRYHEYSFSELEEKFGHMLECDAKEKPFYQYHSLLIKAILELEAELKELHFLFNNPERGGEDTYVYYPGITLQSIRNI